MQENFGSNLSSSQKNNDACAADRALPLDDGSSAPSPPASLQQDIDASLRSLFRCQAEALVASAHVHLLQRQVEASARSAHLHAQEDKIFNTLMLLYKRLQADDVIIDSVLPHLHDSIKKWDPQQSSLSYFLQMRARQPLSNNLRPVRKRKDRFQPIPEVEDAEGNSVEMEYPAPHQFVPSADRIIEQAHFDQIRRCFCAIKGSPPHRHVLILRSFFELSNNEVAEAIASSVNKVRVWYLRALMNFKILWDESPDPTAKDELGVVGVVVQSLPEPKKTAFLLIHFCAFDYFGQFDAQAGIAAVAQEAELIFSGELVRYGWGGSILNFSPICESSEEDQP